MIFVVNTFNGKLTTINQDFNINNIRNSDSVFIYGIIENRESGLNHELPSIRFEIHILILIILDLRTLFHLIIGLI